jgi:DNA-binding PadR family transcriptional regulator
MPDTSQNKVNDAMNFQFDEIISAPCRLGILAALVPGEPVSFTRMKTATSLSDGNLHVQTRKLAEAGYIAINKIKKGKRSVTEFRITGLGRESLRLHVVKLQSILDADKSTGKTDKPSAQTRTAKPVAKAKPDSKPAAKRPRRPVRRPDDSAVWA